MLPIQTASYRIDLQIWLYSDATVEGSELLTVSQAAEALSATSQTIRNWIRSDRLHAKRIGNRFLIPRSEIERLHGDIPSQTGESPWGYDEGELAQPLPRKTAERPPGPDPADGLLGA